MPIHKLTAAWTKVASAGYNASLTNISGVTVEVSKGGGAVTRQLPPNASYGLSEPSVDLYARSREPGGELLATLTPGLSTGKGR